MSIDWKDRGCLLFLLVFGVGSLAIMGTLVLSLIGTVTVRDPTGTVTAAALQYRTGRAPLSKIGDGLFFRIGIGVDSTIALECSDGSRKTTGYVSGLGHTVMDHTTPCSAIANRDRVLSN